MTGLAFAVALAALYGGILIGYRFAQAGRSIDAQLAAADDRGDQVCNAADMAIDGDQSYPTPK